MIATAQKRTYRLHQALTAPREIHPPCNRLEVIAVLQTWCPRVIGTPRNPYGYTRGVGCAGLVRGVGERASLPLVGINRATRVWCTASPWRRTQALMRRPP